jgi:hypothetical protein
MAGPEGKRRTGLEPASSPWKGEALPLSYRRAEEAAPLRGATPMTVCTNHVALCNLVEHVLPTPALDSLRDRELFVSQMVELENDWGRPRRSRRRGALVRMRPGRGSALRPVLSCAAQQRRCSAVCWLGSAPACKRHGRAGNRYPSVLAPAGARQIPRPISPSCSASTVP